MCNKDVASGPTDLISIEESNPTPRIKAFIKQADVQRSGIQKTGGSITSDSAVWYLEAALNYSLTSSWLEFSNAVVDSVTVTCSLNTNGTVDESVVLGAFNSASDILDDIPTTEQHLAVIDAMGSIQSGLLTIVCHYVIGSGYEQSLNTTYTGQDDYMWWQMSQPSGGCVCEDNPNASSYCADRIIQKRINQVVNGGVLGFWTNVETWLVSEQGTDPFNYLIYYDDLLLQSPDPAPPGHSNQETLTFQCDFVDCDNCLDETDMAFHTQGTYDAMLLIRDAHCPTKTPILCKMGGDLHFAPPSHSHQTAQFSYGIAQRY